jgi:hypothetical protein
MISYRWIFCFLGGFALLLGSARVGLTDQWYFYSGQATVTTANCNASGGLCQPSPACNGGAGPNTANIQASVTLCEQRLDAGNVGTILRVSGTGTGFQFGKTYVSLLYLNPNTATCSRFPAGVAPTIQNLAQADSDFASMHLGFWVVNPNGSATLTVAKQATVIGLNNYHTVSVREMQPPNVACYDCGNDPAPQLNALRACGALTVTVAVGNCAIP